MTRDQFIAGKPFYIGTKAYKGDSTYYFNGEGTMCRQTRSSIDDRVILDSYEANVYVKGNTYFEAYTFVLNKKVKVKLKYENLLMLEEEV